MELNCAFFLLATICLSSQTSAEVLVDFALHSWYNPFKIDEYFGCCDGGSSVFPDCTGTCDTRFEFCLQPSQLSMASTNCALGLYRSPASDFVTDADNQSFIFGLDLEGNVPNPMTFHLASYPQDGVRLVLTVFDEDGGDDDLLDVLYVPISVSEIQESAKFSSISTYTGVNGVGTAEFSFRVKCAEGFCGSLCSQFCEDSVALSSRYLMEVAIHSWHNPSRGDAHQQCCDGNDSNFPNCGGNCDTRFEFCVQPFHFSLKNQNCLFGAYDEIFREEWPDSDNIQFITGQDFESGASNPMTFFVPASEEHGFKFTLMAYDIDDELYDDQLLDVVHLVMDREPLVSTEFSSPAFFSGAYGIGTAELSYRVMCAQGYCGSDCAQLCQPPPAPVHTDFIPTDSTLPTDDGFFVGSNLAILLTTLAVILVVCIVMVTLLFLVVGLLCRRAPIHKFEQSTSISQNRAATLPGYVDGPVASGDIAVASLHLPQHPSAMCNTTNSSSISIGSVQLMTSPPRTRNNSRAELIAEHTTMYQETEEYYSVISTKEFSAHRLHTSTDQLPNMYMNPAYGTGTHIRTKELSSSS